MQLAGTYVFNAPAVRVWDFLTDPKAISGCIQGCESLESAGPNRYDAVLNVGIGPIRGRYNGSVAMTDLDPPESFRLSVEGKGAMGFITGGANVTLAEQDGKTTVKVQSEAQVGGPVARVGQRLMEAAARNMMDQFFNCLRQAVG